MSNRRDRNYIKIKEGDTTFVFNKNDYPFALNEVQALMLERLGDKNYTHYPSDKVLKRFRLWWVQRGFCFWCHEPMTFGMYPDGRIPPKECTIDHLDSRNTRRRGNYKNQDIPRLVGACNNCNHNRGKEEDIAKRQNGDKKL